MGFCHGRNLDNGKHISFGMPAALDHTKNLLAHGNEACRQNQPSDFGFLPNIHHERFTRFATMRKHRCHCASEKAMKETITVKYFASLREELGKSQEMVSVAGIRTVGDVWQAVTREQQTQLQQILCAVNKTYASFDTPVNSGDEVAFFPPVSGG